MKLVALNAVARIDRSVATEGECKALPYVGLEHIEKESGRFAADFKSQPEALLATKFRFTSRHVLYGKLRPYLNKVVMPNFDGVCTTEILPILPKVNQLDRGYLHAFLLSARFVEWASANVSGANLPRLDPKRLAEFQIPLPPLSEQQRIAAILKKADRLRRMRRFAQELSETYLQSVFVKMFGDPVTNSMGWEIAKLRSLGELDRGRSKHRPRNAPFLFGGSYPFIQTGDVANSSGYIRGYKQTYSEAGLKQSKLWPTGTLCITIAANIAKTAILTFEACFPDSIVGFSPNQRTGTEFIQHWLSFVQREIEDTAPESAQKNINLEILRELDVMLPPKGHQDKFAYIIRQFERLRTQQREAARQAEHLFQTLLQRAFRGEL